MNDTDFDLDFFDDTGCYQDELTASEIADLLANVNDFERYNVA